jgi:hypothetical protein
MRIDRPIFPRLVADQDRVRHFDRLVHDPDKIVTGFNGAVVEEQLVAMAEFQRGLAWSGGRSIGECEKEVKRSPERDGSRSSKPTSPRIRNGQHRKRVKL